MNLATLRQQYPTQTDETLFDFAMTQMRLQTEEADKETEELRKRLHQVEGLAASSASTERHVAPLSPSQNSKQNGSLKLPKLPSFSGDKKEYPVWKRLMQDRLAAEGTAASWLEQTRFVRAHVLGNAAIYLEHFASMKGDAQYEASEMLQYLDQRYDDPHKAQKAMSEHARCRQGNQEFSEFMAELDRLQSEAGIDRWGDEIRIQLLEQKINGEMQQLTIAMPDPPSTYSGYVRQLHKIANNLSRVKANGAFRYGIGGNKDKSTSKGTPPPINFVTAAEPTSLPPASKDPNVMDWAQTNQTDAGNRNKRDSDKRPRAPPCSQEEFDERRKQRVCYTCGNAGHIARRCYYAPPRRPVQTNNVIAQPPSIVMLTAGNSGTRNEEDESSEAEKE
jgi:hypothetical protein